MNITFNVPRYSSLPRSLAEEQVHEEVAERRRGLQCAGGGGGLPGYTICGVCSSAASCDAGGLDRGSCSHKVESLVVLPSLTVQGTARNLWKTPSNVENIR